MELLILFTIPCVLVSSIYGQYTGIELGKTGKVIGKEGELFSVSCRLSENTPGYDSATYQWFNQSNNEVVSSNSNDHVIVRPIKDYGKRLMIFNLKDDDSGTYVCQATSGQEVYKANFTLEVKRIISFIKCPDKQRGLMGKEATLRCQASGSGLETWWERNGNTVDLENPRYRLTDNGYLVISGLNDNDVGQYKYGALSSQGDMDQRKVNLEIVVAPSILTPIRERIAVAGEPHKMFCSVGGRPLPTIQWYKQGTANALASTDRLKVEMKDENGVRQGTLAFEPVLKEDEGIYTCKAVGVKINDEDDIALENSTTSELKVYTPPIVEDMVEQERSEGGGAELVCIVRGDPVPDVLWQKADTQKQYSTGSNEDGITVSEGDLGDANNPGVEIKLQFQSLKSTDAGIYKCVATSDAGEDENSVELKVTYKPNFDDQQTGPFYTWLGYSEGYIPCTGKGNPAPTFKWYKLNDGNPVEVTSLDPDYTVTREEDDVDVFKVTSKLLVSYTGSNRNVFGDYQCVATNKVGDTPQTLTISEGLKPAPPLVSAHEVYATQIVFWISDQPVNGPPVTKYELSYKNNGTDVKLYQFKEDKVFTDDKSGDPKTKFIVKPLSPRTEYTFNIHAINLVDKGDARVTTLETKALSQPGIVRILNEASNQYPNKIDMSWVEPDNGGSAILEYHLSYREVNVKPNNATLNPQLGYELDERNPYVGQETVVRGIKDTRYPIRTGIRPGMYYMIKVTAHNGQGPGVPGQIIIKTKEGPGIGNVGGAPRLVSVSTSLTLFGCLAALSACFKSFV